MDYATDSTEQFEADLAAGLFDDQIAEADEIDADYYDMDDEERYGSPINTVMVDRDTGEFYYLMADGSGRIYKDGEED